MPQKKPIESKKYDQPPAQTQSTQPGEESEMDPPPVYVRPGYKGSDKLKGKSTLITGGDSGIGRAAAVAFAIEGADVAIVYLDESKDAQVTKSIIEKQGRQCLLLPGDVGDESFCQSAVAQTVKAFGKLDVLVNNAAEQHPKDSITEITSEQLEKTFRTNIFSMFYLVKAALPHLEKQKGSNIINTTSVTAYRGSAKLLDYSSTKGAIVSFTRALSESLADKGIRVNAIAPGPIWTPLIPATFPKEKVGKFGQDVPLGRPGQPCEVSGCYVFLASDDATYFTGQVLHPNGGEIVNG